MVPTVSTNDRCGSTAEIDRDLRVRPLTSPIADAHFLSPSTINLAEFGQLQT